MPDHDKQKQQDTTPLPAMIRSVSAQIDPASLPPVQFLVMVDAIARDLVDNEGVSWNEIHTLCSAYALVIQKGRAAQGSSLIEMIGKLGGG